MKALKKLFIIYLAFLPLFTGFLSLGGDFGKLLNPAHSVEAQSVTLQVTNFPLPSRNKPYDLSVGPDGNFWFPVYDDATNFSLIVKITPSGDFTEFPVATNASITNLTAGPDGNLWFTEFYPKQIGKITTSGTVTEYKLPQERNLWPRDITTGPDGNLWFVNSIITKDDFPYQSILTRMTPDGDVTEFPIPGMNNGTPIVTGPDNNFWFLAEGKYIARVTPSGEYTEFPLSAQPVGIVSGPNNTLWFGEVNGDKNFGKVSTDGTVTEYKIFDGDPGAIALGPDNNLWLLKHDKLYIVDVEGNIIAEYLLSEVTNGGYGMVFGPDGNLWFSNWGESKIVRIDLSMLPEVTPSITPTTTPGVTPTPDATPTAEPSSTPELTPTPTVEPTVEPNATPTVMPTTEPTATPAPTDTPTVETNDEENNHITPTATPSPTVAPTTTPTPTNTPANDDDDSDTEAEVLGASTLPNTSAGNRGMAVVVTGIFGLFVGFFLIAFHFAVRLRNVYVKKPSNYVIYKKA